MLILDVHLYIKDRNILAGPYVQTGRGLSNQVKRVKLSVEI